LFCIAKWRADRLTFKHAEYIPDYQNANSGDDISGIVHEVGENVDEFRVGDRVAAFHEMLKPAGSFAEYAVAWKHTTFFLPKGTSFEGMHILIFATTRHLSKDIHD
jgi:NADPH2:quinone reductase